MKMKVLLQTLLFQFILVRSILTVEIYNNTKIVQDKDYWSKNAQLDLQAAAALYKQIKHHRAKNAILFLGDGMGITTITSGRILKGQLRNHSGEEEQLAFEKFPHTALIKVYNTDMQTPDSAGTATAYLSGVKARSGTIGVDQYVIYEDCASYSEANNVISFLEKAHSAGKSVGIVTTTRITHATPAVSYAHTVSRNWEDDTDRNAQVDSAIRNRCPDIAAQLIEKSLKLTVAFGGGRRKFLPKSVTFRHRINNILMAGTRSDGRNLINEWKEKNKHRRPKYIETRDELMNLSPTSTDSVLGLFAPSHLQYDIDNQALDLSKREPTIREMTEKALQILKRNPNGFALLVEGGRIDHGHHENKANKALHDLVAFDAAIDSTIRQVDHEETLTLVTADHSHVFSIGGWAGRGNAIFGKIKFSYDNQHNAWGDALGKDNLPYTSLNYADGPSAPINMSRRDITNVSTQDVNYRQSAIVNQVIESHGSEDVAVYAIGPGAHLFHSTHEQSYVSHLIQHSLCIGEYDNNDNCLPAKSASDLLVSGQICVLLTMTVLFTKTII